MRATQASKLSKFEQAKQTVLDQISKLPRSDLKFCHGQNPKQHMRMAVSAENVVSKELYAGQARIFVNSI